MQKLEGKVNWRQVFNKFISLNFLKFSQYCNEISVIKRLQRKAKNIFLDENSKNHFTLDIA